MITIKLLKEHKEGGFLTSWSYLVQFILAIKHF